MKVRGSAWIAFAVFLLAAGPALAEPVLIRGRVLDSAGQPLSGATAELIPYLDKAARRQDRLKGRFQPEPVSTATSDSQGSFTLRAPEPGMWQVGVRARGFVPQQMALPLLEATDLTAVRMVPDSPLKLRIVDAGGKPVAGAQVVASTDVAAPSWRFQPFELWRPAWRIVKAGDDGTVLLPKAAGEGLQIWASAPGFAAGSLEKVTPAEAQLTLPQGCNLVVEVVDPERRPVSGALIVADLWTVGATDATGRLTVAAPCGAELPVIGQVRDGREAEGTVSPARRASGEPFRLTLPARAPRLTGRVLEEGSRAAIAGAFVWPSDDPGSFVRTDRDGTYVLSVPAARLSLMAASVSHFSTEQERASPAEGAQEAGPTLLLPPSAVIRGMVVDGAGKAVEGAELRLSEPPAWSEARQIARSGSEGAFQVRVPPGRAQTLQVTRDGFSPTRFELPGQAPHAVHSGVRIVLDPGQRASGKVLDPAGKPIAGARLALFQDGGEGFGLFGEAGSFEASSGADGRFSFQHLPAGRYDLNARASGFAAVRVRGLEIGKEARPASLGTVVLHPGVALEGRVVDAKDQPIAGAQVRILEMDPFMTLGGMEDGRNEVTGADGRFTARDLASGDKVWLSVSAEGYVSRRLDGIEVSSSEPLRIALAPAARVSGRVLDEDRKPVAGASVILTSRGTAAVFGGETVMGRPLDSAMTDEKGKFTMDGAEPGPATLQITARELLPYKSDLELAAGKGAENLEVILSLGLTVAGRVLGPDGEPLSDAYVRLLGEQDPFAPFISAHSDEEGRYRLQGVAPGLHSFEANHGEYQRAVRDLEVQPGDNRLDFRLTQGLSVEGRVLDPEGKPVDGAHVYLQSSDGIDAMALESAGDGAFRFPSVAAGTYSLQASKEGVGGGRVPAVEVKAPVRGLEVRLERSTGVIRGRITGLDFRELTRVMVVAEQEEKSSHGKVDYQGEYRIESLSPGEWRVAAVEETTGRQATGKVALAANAEAVLDLEFRDSGLTLSGRILRRREPVPGLQVFAASKQVESNGRATSNQEGAFRMTGLEPGTYDLIVAEFQTGRFHQETVELTADRDIVVDLPENRVSGEVVDAADSSPLEGVMVSLELQAAENALTGSMGVGTSSDRQGDFTLTDISPGAYRIVARKEGYAPTESTVQVTPGSSVDGVRLALSATQGLVLQVRSSTGTAPESVSVALLDPSGRAVLASGHTVGENGRVRITTAPAGSWRLLVAGGGSATTAVDVKAPGQPIPVLLSPSSPLEVRVPDLADSSLLATLTIQGADGRPFQSIRWGAPIREWRLADGKAKVEDLPPGNWQLTVTAPDGRTWKGTATAAPGAAREVTLR